MSVYAGPPCPTCEHGKLYTAEARQRGYCGVCECRRESRTVRHCASCATMSMVQPCYPGCGVTA